MNIVIRNKQILIDEDTCWKFGGDKVPGGNEGLAERLSIRVKGERWDLITGGSKFDDGREKLVTFWCLWKEKFWWILAVQCMDGNTLQICGQLIDLTL